MEIPNVPESDAVVPVARRRGRPKKFHPQEKMEREGLDLSDIPKVASELEKIDYRPMAKVMDHSLQNKWMQQYLVPGKFKLILHDTRGKYKAGKVVFIVEGVKSNMDPTGKAICLCICDVLVDQDGAVVRKPNYAAASAGKAGKHRTKMYQQVFIPMNMVDDVARAMLSLVGTDFAKEAIVDHEAARVAVEQQKEEQYVVDNFDRLFGGR